MSLVLLEDLAIGSARTYERFAPSRRWRRDFGTLRPCLVQKKTFNLSVRLSVFLACWISDALGVVRRLLAIFSLRKF